MVVSGWDRAEVRVTGTLGRRIEKLEITGSDQRLDLRVVYPRNCHDCGDADLELKVPAGCRFEAETVSADLELGGVRGEVWLKSVSGRVRVAAGGSLRAKTVSGPLVIRGAGRAVNATTVSGASVPTSRCSRTASSRPFRATSRSTPTWHRRRGWRSRP